jgi:hypothetical protein
MASDLKTAQPEAPAEPKRAALPATLSIVAKLKAMSENYSGGHCWDSLDSVTCAAAAATIEFLLATPAPAAQQPAVLVIRCPERLKNGGSCPHHNLHCGWPACNEEK